ncbi:MAG: hypothetical protein ACREQ9_04175, partial [Candidatus Binatia bacterium]
LKSLHDPLRPKRSLGRIQTIARVLTVLALGAIAAFYVERFDEDLLELVPWTLTALSLLLPLVSAAWLEVAQQTDHRNAIARRYLRAERNRAELDRRLASATALRAKLTGNGHDPVAWSAAEEGS